MAKVNPLLRGAVDGLAVLAAFAGAYAVRQWEPFQALRFPIQPLEFYLPLLPIALVSFVAVVWQHGLYARAVPAANLAALTKIVRAVAVWLTLLMAGSYLTQHGPSRALLLLLGAFTLMGTVVGRSLVHVWEGRRKLGSSARVLVVGASAPNVASEPLATNVTDGEHLHLAIDPRGSAPELAQSIATMLRDKGVSHVVLLDRSLPRETILSLIALLADVPNLRFSTLSEYFPLLKGDQGLLSLGTGMATLDLHAPEQGLWTNGGKRAMDLIVSLALAPLVLPLVGIIVLAIWGESGRPAFFAHPRVGLRERRFRMLKFRTMRADPPAADAPEDPTDERVTAVGRFLRRWSLDELPQFWNVLQGEMSLVGPRPAMLYIANQCTPWQRMRFRVRPGLTGLWQVLGRKDLPLQKHLEYDVYYVHNASFALDLAILLKTVPRILTGRGAY
ncbi:MAG: exopolysaccharide biosynthesis polyprenyl glycosylphosphotransferase [Parcubacteria group bacterium Gr01-1014_38]|nr:MAG: exopolysaccharide biosynthesis polyprenyl glycosylphosphotransferase [Parcubacteria group bacterium Gr01-1014_38]